MFTWRELKKKFISTHYFRNIINLIENFVLYEELVKNNILIYFSILHLLDKYINKYKEKYKNNNHIKFININNIYNCLLNPNLVVSDFSSIIFDLIYRQKLFIIYIPDANDPQIKDIYTENYYELFESMKNGTIEFYNKFCEVKETINKIIYYLANHFNLEPKLKKF